MAVEISRGSEYSSTEARADHPKPRWVGAPLTPVREAVKGSNVYMEARAAPTSHSLVRFAKAGHEIPVVRICFFFLTIFSYIQQSVEYRDALINKSEC